MKNRYYLILGCLFTSIFQSVYANNLPMTKGTPVNTSSTDSINVDTLSEVTVRATRLLLVTKNDTTIYDLDALTIKEGALLRDAFERLPGMSFRNGVLYHNGREVNSILINGVDFSRKDPMLALQTLPSYIMKDVKVYERQSDFSMMHGKDDGFRELVADVTVRRKYMGTWTGEIAAGGGSDKRFMGRGFANTFTDQYRISLFGNANNINEQIWYSGDGRQCPGDAVAGDNRYYTPGATFYWKNKLRQKQKGYFKIEGSVDYNKEQHDNNTQTERELYLSDGSMYSASDVQKNSDTDRIAAMMRLDWKIADATSLSYQGNLDIHQHTENLSSLTANWNERPEYGEHLADTLLYLSIAPPYQPSVIDIQRKSVLNRGDAAKYDHNLKITHAIADKDIYISLFHNMHIGYDSGAEHNQTYYKYFNTEHTNSTLINRYKDMQSNNSKQDVKARIMKYYDVKGFNYFCTSLVYDYKYQHEEHDEHGYLLNNLGGVYNDPTTSHELFGTLPTDASWRSVAMEDETTRHWESTSNTHSITPAIDLGKEIFYMELWPTICFAKERLYYTKGTLPTLTPERDYIYVDLKSQFRFSTDKLGTLRFYGDISHTLPDILSLVTYPDMADPQYIIYGNEALKKSTKYNLRSSYNKDLISYRADSSKVTRQLSANLNVAFIENDFTNLMTYDRVSGEVTSTPINVSGNWYGSLGANFTTPLDRSQRFWLEVSANAHIHHTNSYAVVGHKDEQPMLNSNYLHAYSAKVKPRAKFSNIDASIAYELTLENNRSTYIAGNNKELWQHHIQGRLTWQLPWSLNFDAVINYQNYAAYHADRKRMDWLMMDFSIERYFLKGKNLLVEISAHDLLNENTGFTRMYDATSLTNTYNNTLGRYAMLSVKYRFATKKK